MGIPNVFPVKESGLLRKGPVVMTWEPWRLLEHTDVVVPDEPRGTSWNRLLGHDECVEFLPMDGQQRTLCRDAIYQI